LNGVFGAWTDSVPMPIVSGHALAGSEFCRESIQIEKPKDRLKLTAV
jgi:hypothetical protein